ncbi:efflux transporter outer membrane subunit [Roseateles sp. DAIF2]|uniref:efflux transporter outer membrane subunit n=1 Tax=Roseateles sp. DAIF2 TaxID=2714952 RepID=UPI0018A2E451|nr:efflux transporter outer membrane subunit [Roseateles sp. DAIF2]QPF72192.1 efflux transporter outer membrane subunit [Roseateles sp. DAIF2]
MNEKKENEMSFLTKTRLLTPLLAALVLAGCANVPVAEPHALPATPAAFKKHQALPGAATQAQLEWWKTFADPQLDALTAQALAHNTSLQAATARLAQARALLKNADANRLPQLGAQGGAARQGGDAAQQRGSSYNVGLAASYELDLVGRLSQASRAARLDAQAAESLLAGARLLVQADVAQTYFALRALDAERALVRETVAAYRDTLKLTERRHAAGDIAELDVARVRTEVASTEAQALALDRRRSELETALAVLVGELPASLAVAEGQWTETLPLVPAGLPSSMLARRPDIAAAQAGYQAAQQRLGVAQKAWFPTLNLTATAGGVSPELSDLFKSSAGLWGVNALLSLPLFDGGRREAGVQNAAAQADEAAARYREQVLLAFKDVEDQLSGLALLAAQREVQAQAVASAQRALQLSDSRYRNGLVSQLELLDARRSELANRRQALQVRAAQYQSTIALIKALGGGWG